LKFLESSQNQSFMLFLSFFHSHLIPSLAIVTKDEVGHGFVGSFDLNLDKASSVTTAFLTFEHAFIFVILFDDLLGPVSALVPETFEHLLFTFLLHLGGSELSEVHGAKLFGADGAEDESEEGFRILWILQIENETA
jgi:hypothetical protein